MAKPQGSVKTGGRQKGTPNRRTEERRARLEETRKAIEQALPAAFHGDGHALLMAVYKNEDLPIELRLDAAKAAIAYEKPKLAVVELKAEVDATVAVSRIELVAPSMPCDAFSTSR